MSQIDIAYKTGQSVPLDKIKGLQGDLKSLSDENYARLKHEIIDTGFAFPLHCWQNPKDKQWYICDGHQRFEALKRLRDEGYKIPALPIVVVQAKDLRAAKRRVLQATSQYGQMTEDSLAKFMNSAKLDIDFVRERFDLPHIDFDQFERNFLEHNGKIVSVSEHQRTIGKTDPDEIPDKVKSVCKLGDLWQLGEHRLLCGDSTDKANVERLMNGEKADMVFTDPPYGISVVQGASVGGSKPFGTVGAKNGTCKRIIKAGEYKQIAGDENCDAAKAAYALCESLNIKTMCFWGANYYAQALPDKMKWIVWYKETTGNFADCELAWTNLEGRVQLFKHTWNGLIKESERRDKRVHPTQKPIALAEWCINELMPEAKSVLDLFGGSGSTLIACEKTGRKCFMMELDPYYCDVIINRWQNFTGKVAKRIK